jgi:glycosyltransferase involved in cell wall biosynthesis
MLLSVVITTYNRSDVLKQNLDQFKEQTDKEFEIVAAIDGSTDNTINMLKNYRLSVDFDIKWVDTEETNKYCLAKARNMGLIETSGEAVVILDDDSFPAPNFVEEHKKSVSAAVLTGGYRNSHDSNDSMHRKMSRVLNKYGDCTIHPIGEILVENNCCMFRKDWIGCGMFSERFEGYGGCGQELFMRLAYLGYRYQFNPRAMIFHHKEFEGDNGLTRSMKTEQAKEMSKVIHKHTWSY